MLRHIALLVGTLLFVRALDSFGIPFAINIMILMAVGLYICIDSDIQTGANVNDGPLTWDDQTKWSQEDWDNWDHGSKESIDKLYENGDIKFKRNY